MKKINTKLNAILLGSILIMGLLLILILTPIMMRDMQGQMQQQTLNLAKTQLTSIKNYTQSTSAELSLMSHSLNSGNLANSLKQFQTIRDSNSQFVSAHLFDSKGDDLSTKKKDSSNPLYTLGRSKGTYIGPVQKTIGANFDVPMASSIVDSNGKFQGVIANQLDIGSAWLELRGIVDHSTATIDPNQYSFLVSKDGYIIATDDMKAVLDQVTKQGKVIPAMKNNQAFLNMTNQINQTHNFKEVSGNGMFKSSDGKHYFMTYAYSPLLGAAVFVKTSKAMILGPIYNLIGLIIGLVLACVVLLGIFGYLFSRRLTRPIHELVTLTDQVSGGDLTHKMITNRQDELGILANSFNTMIDHLKALVSKSHEASIQTVSATQFLEERAQNISIASEHVSQSISEIASGAEKQAQLSQDTEATLNDFLTMNEQVVFKNKEVYDQALSTQKVLGESQKSLQSVIQGVERLSHSTRESMHHVEELKSTAMMISGIVKDTNTIADQTSLLALNAAIEAARAGEAGKGFSVVADEIRKLSEQSKQSSHRIQHIIKDVLASIDQACAQMEENIQNGEKEQQNATGAAKTLPVIVESMNQVVQRVQDIEDLFSKQKTVIQTIHEHSKEASIVSMSTSAGVEEVAASSEQTNESMHEILTEMQELSKLALSLNVTVQEFQIEQETLEANEENAEVQIKDDQDDTRDPSNL